MTAAIGVSAVGCGGSRPRETTPVGAQHCLESHPAVGAARASLGNYDGLDGNTQAFIVVFPLDGRTPPGEGTLYITRSSAAAAQLPARLDGQYERAAKQTHSQFTGFSKSKLHVSGNAAWYWHVQPTKADEDVLVACLRS